MADGTSTHIVQYLGDLTAIEHSIDQLESVNKRMAVTLQDDVARAVGVIRRDLNNLTKERVRIPIDVSTPEKVKSAEAKGFSSEEISQGFKEVEKRTERVNTLIEDSNGRFRNFAETLTFVDGDLRKTSGSIKDLTINEINLLKQQQKLTGQSSQLSTNFTNLTDINKKFSSQLSQFGTVNNQVGTTLKKVGDNGTQISKIFETTSGKFVQLTESTKRNSEGLQTVNRSVKEVSKTYVENAKTLENTNKRTISYTENIKRLANRALLTIPIWFAIRSSISSLSRTFRNGIKDIVDFDKAFQKARRNLQGTPEEIGKNFETLQSRVKALSLETGVSVDDITNAFQKFATVGFNFEDSLAGAINSTKLSILLFGDATETADAFSRALRVLVDRTDGAKSSQDQIAEAMALTAELWKENQFDINEVNQALEKFAPAAKSANLSMNQTLALLATLGTAATGGARGGTLLRTSIQKLVENLDDATRILGIKFNPAVDDTFTVLLKAVDAMAQLDSNSKIAIDRQEALSEIFGGIRGSLPIQGFISLNAELKRNASILPNVSKFNKDVEEVLKTVNKQADIFKNTLRLTGLEFVSAVINGEDFAQTLENLTEGVKNLTPALIGLGVVLNTIFVNFGLISAVGFLNIFQKRLITGIPAAFLKSRATIVGIGVLYGKIFSGGFLAGMKNLPLLIAASFTKIGLKGFGLGLARAIIPVATFLTIAKVAADAFSNGYVKRQNENASKIADVHTRINQALRKTLDKAELEKLIVELKGVELDIDSALKSKLVSQFEEDLQKEFDSKGTRINVNKTVLDRTERQAITDRIIQDQLDRLSNEGALTSEIIKQNQILNKQFENQGTILDQLNLELDRQKAINEEKRLSNRISSDSLKLFDIAQTEGTDIARRIGDVLAGNTDFDLFVKKGGRALDVFKEQFADIFKGQQAERFFKGLKVPELEGLRGGSRIAIEEDSIRGISTSINATLAKARAETLALNLKNDPVDRNTEATEKNTTSIRELVSIFKEGTGLFGEDARRVVEFQTQNAQSAPFINNQPVNNVTSAGIRNTETLNINVNVDGKNVSLVGTPDRIRELAQQIGPQVSKAVEDKLIRDLSNPQSPFGKADRQNIEEF